MHEIQLRVRYAECDMQGRVFNGHYLTWLDMAHTEALRTALGDYAGIVARGVEFVVAECTIRYRRAAHFDDELTVGVRFQEPGTTSLTSEFVVRRGEETVAEASMRHVCVDAKEFAKTPWPEWARAGLLAARG